MSDSSRRTGLPPRLTRTRPPGARIEDRRWQLQNILLQADPATGVDQRVLALLGDNSASSHRVTAPDGTVISYKQFGQGDRVVAFCNGLGGTYRTFADVFAGLVHDHRIIVYDYRGLFESGPPPEGDPLAVDTHAADLFLVLDDAGIDRATVFGWSMGVQVALEAWRRAPERVEAMVFASGVDGHLLDGVPFFFGSSTVALTLARLMRDRGAGLTDFLARTCRAQAVKRLARTLRLVGRNADVTLEHAALLLSSDPRIYWAIVERLQEHDASEVVDTITIPVLILHGDSDVVTPVAKGRELRTRIVGSEIWVFSGCTHAVILEYPERVVRHLRDFLQRRVSAR